MRTASSWWLAGAAIALALGVSAPARAQQDTDAVEIAQAEGGQIWFVELSGAPVADGGNLSALRNEKAAFRRAAAAAGIGFVERRAYDVLFNGFAVVVSPVDRAKLAQVAGVKAMYPVEVVYAPTPAEGGEGSAPDMVAAVALSGANRAQTELGLTGSGVRVGIVDSGIDIDHPAFGGGGSNGGTLFPSTRVAFGYDFVGDAYNADPSSASYNPVPAPDPNPDDCGGHGTHVAGIVGGNDSVVRGVAPEVTFGAYRVFGCAGSTTSDIILAALERAYADGMHVVNQSLGAARQWPQYPTAQASTRLVNKGVVMVASIGNNGPGGSTPDSLFAAGAPGVGAKVIGVASYDNAQRAFTVNGTPYGFNGATGSPLAPTSGQLPMARTGTTASTADGCPPWQASFGGAPWSGGAWLAPASLTGQAVLIRRGTCSFYAKAYNAELAGAAAVVLYNNAAGALSPTVAVPTAGAPAIGIPVVAVTDAQGATLNGLIAAGPTTLVWTNQYVGYPYGTGGLISGFSSFGLAADLSLKPNLGAPGGAIYSSYPLERGGYATLSGTSMSSPHVAGGVALVLQARPRVPANGMLSLLQNSADPKAWAGNPGLGFLDHVHRQGAGMLDLMGSIQATASIEPSQISLGESEAGPATRTLTIRNTGASAVTFDVSHAPALANGPNALTGTSYVVTGTFNAPATVSFSAGSVTVPAGGTATVEVTIAPHVGLVDRGLYGGYVVFTAQGTGVVYRVPYAGFKGDYQSTQVLTQQSGSNPRLNQLVGGSFFTRPAGGTYALGDDAVYVRLHLDHHVRRIRLEAVDALSGLVIGRVSDDEYVARNATPTGTYLFAWDGALFQGKGKNANQWSAVANGQYFVKVSVLKALGDEANPAHWETWTSPLITIARP